MAPPVLYPEAASIRVITSSNKLLIRSIVLCSTFNNNYSLDTITSSFVLSISVHSKLICNYITIFDVNHIIRITYSIDSNLFFFNKSLTVKDVRITNDFAHLRCVK